MIPLKSVKPNELAIQNSSEDCISDANELHDFQSENAAKERNLLQLTSELNRVQEVAKQVAIESRVKITDLEEINQDLSNRLSGLELKISTMSDYETTKKDLSILRSLEFGIDDEQEQRPLEVMILERSKTLQVILY